MEYSMSKEDRDQALFDKIAAQYARKDIALSSALARKNQLLTTLGSLLVENTRWDTIVDIGCGVGAPASYLDGRYQRYIGIDQSTDMINAAAIFNRDFTRASFLADNIKETQLADNSADLILSIGALHHMTELDKVMESLVAIAKPGAMLFVIEPQNANTLIQLMRWARGYIDKGYSREQIFFSEADLIELLTKHGIDNLQVTYFGYITPPFTQVIIPPQTISVPACRMAIHIDNWLYTHLRGPLQKLSFNIVLIGRFPTR
jgi:ubiquinone/menaquinone biosynthesis C-methylase UbiE